MSAKSKFLGAAAIAGLVVADGLAFAPAHAETVTFIPGTYYLAEDYLGTPVDTLVVSISGGVAYFSLSGEDTATFAVQNNSTPTGDDGNGDPGNPYFSVASIVSASWNAADYPYLTFWSTFDAGGVTAGTATGDSGTNLFDIFQSTDGTGQVFTLSVREPSTWALMLIGFAGLGLASAWRNAMRRLDATTA